MVLGEISEDIREVFEDIVNETNLFNFMNFYYYSVGKQKPTVKVNKLNPIGEKVSEMPGTIVITVDEAVFSKLSPNQQKMLAEDAIATINYDSEKDKISIDAPVITMTIGGWRKYGEELANTYELCRLTAQQMEEERKEAKAAEQEAKRAKNQ